MIMRALKIRKFQDFCQREGEEGVRKAVSLAYRELNPGSELKINILMYKLSNVV